MRYLHNLSWFSHEFNDFGILHNCRKIPELGRMAVGPRSIRNMRYDWLDY